MNTTKLCGWCGLSVCLNKEVKVWSEIDGVYYHNLCLKNAMDDARRYAEIDKVVRPHYSSYPRVGNMITIIDIWVCNLCGGRTGGYGREKCVHCGAPAHYGSNNGYYTNTSAVLKEADDLRQK